MKVIIIDLDLSLFKVQLMTGHRILNICTSRYHDVPTLSSLMRSGHITMLQLVTKLSRVVFRRCLRDFEMPVEITFQNIKYWRGGEELASSTLD
jgi:hypothetical protein